MHLIQLFLPLYDNDGQPFPRALFDAVRAELAEAFGGVTAYTRAPATGLWEDDAGRVQRDDVLLFKFHDSDHSRTWRCPHTAFHDPSFADANIRESIEVRTVAFWE